MVDVKPIQAKTYKHEQSPSEFIPKLPARIIISGPSGGGKGVLCLNLLLNPKLYKGCFSAVYYASGSSTLDTNLKPLQKYCESELGMKKDECMIDGWQEDKIKAIISKQRKKVREAKKKGDTSIEGICIVCDDMADNHKAMHSSTLNSLFTRGRHSCITTIVMTQKYRLLDSTIRVNATALFVFRMRNNKDLEAVLEENSAMADKKTLLDAYNLATKEPYQFLYIDLTKSQPNEAFFKGFQTRLKVE